LVLSFIAERHVELQDLRDSGLSILINGQHVVGLLLERPDGIGAFLVLLGTFIWLLAKANEITKRVKKG
jgi:hypothetical protein